MLAKASLCNSSNLQKDIFQNQESEFLSGKFILILNCVEEIDNL